MVYAGVVAVSYEGDNKSMQKDTKIEENSQMPRPLFIFPCSYCCTGGNGLRGMISHASRYASATGMNAVATAMTIVTTRTTVESTSRYSAMPPHTPTNFVSVSEM